MKIYISFQAYFSNTLTIQYTQRIINLWNIFGGLVPDPILTFLYILIKNQNILI